MDSADDAGRATSSGGLPNVVVVLEATAEFMGDPRFQNLVQNARAVLIVSRTIKVSLPDAPVVLYPCKRIYVVALQQSEKRGINLNSEPLCSMSGSRVGPRTMSETASAFFYVGDFRQV